MTPGCVTFAVPGDLTTLTGGYIYDRRVIKELRQLGWRVDHLALPAGFPNPSTREMSDALRLLHALPPHQPVIMDGLAYGALDPQGVAALAAPKVALVHHPLAKENGLSAAQARTFHRIERQNLSQAAHVLVPSPHTASILASDYDVPTERITIARPGIDQPSGLARPMDPPLILSVGIQLPRKGHDVLLHALAAVTDLPWQAMIVGGRLDADYATQLQDLCTSLALSDRVRLMGQVERNDLQDLYRQASLFALATRYEGYGIVFDEALVHGLPTVSCDTGAVADTVPQAAGHLVPPDQPVAFAAALRQLLSNDGERQACATVARAAGQACPGWADTARIVAKALAAMPMDRAQT